MSIRIGQHVRHTPRCSGMACEAGTAIAIIDKWDNGLGGFGNSGVYNPPVIVVALDEAFVTGGNDGFASAPEDCWEMTEKWH